jgi:hypothetical protein
MRNFVLAFLAVALSHGWFVFSAKGNVYATNVRLNNSVTNLSLSTANNITISYVLNEPASAGVTITVKSGTNVVRTINRSGGTAGALRGANSVIWDGNDNATNSVTAGIYSVEITAAADGFGTWTQISDDATEGNYAAYTPAGIAVNRNTNSPYYGRVFVANASALSFVSGVKEGIIKCNADGSTPADGLFSSGGWSWTGNTNSPWKLEVSADDFLYANDWSSNGIVLRFNQTISSNSLLTVLRGDNWPNGGLARLSGPAITGSGTNAQLWMTDVNTNGVGIQRFDLATNGVVATNDIGVTVVPAGGTSQLTDAPYDVAVDRSNRIYTIQFETSAGNTNHRVLRLPAYTGTPLTSADWRVGAGDDAFNGASGVAVDGSASYVAVALRSGGVQILIAADGAAVTTLSPGFHDHTDVAWDNVGNLYVCDNLDQVWRAYSPPGGNEATTVALAMIQITPATPLTLSAPVYVGGQFQFTLNGQPNVSYVILSSTNLQNWLPIATNQSASATRLITIAAPDSYRFYRASSQ